MKHGIAYKNLTDAIALVAVFMAVASILLAVLAFDGPTTVKDEITGEEIYIESVFDDPAVKENIKMAAIFIVVAAFGFWVRKWFLLPIVVSVVAIVLSMNSFMEGTLEKVAFAYVVFAIIGLAGNIIYAVLAFEEAKEEAKLKREAAKKEKNASHKK